MAASRGRRGSVHELLETKLAGAVHIGDPPEVREAALYRLGRTQVELAAWPEASTAFDQLAQEFPSRHLCRLRSVRLSTSRG